MLRGIDVSNWQGSIDWPLVARCGTDFAAIKATEGSAASFAYFDPYFLQNWAQAKNAGLVRLAYAFGRPSLGSGRADAQYFLDHVRGVIVAGDLVALDLEDDQVTPTADLRAYVLDFVNAVFVAIGAWPLIYSSARYLRAHNCQYGPGLERLGLWLAAWQSTWPMDLAGWPFLALWQYSAHGSQPGVSGAVDLDLFNGTREELLAYGRTP